MLTVFSAPKPFQGHIATIQHNAIRSWVNLAPEVDVILVGDDPGVAEASKEHGVRHAPRVSRNPQGTPRLDSIFRLAREMARYPLMCYVNADVMLLSDLLLAVEAVRRRFDAFLVVGQRWDLDVPTPLDFDRGWEARLRRDLAQRGRRHPPAGSDYFAFPRVCFESLPAFALGRAGWDNWMIYHARQRHWPVVDGSETITVIHQDHDYGHLPGGVPHYRLPESDRNLELAGGRHTVFALRDADWELTDGGLRRAPLTLKDMPRRFEAALFLWAGPGPMGEWVRRILHPVDTLCYFIGRLRHRLPSAGVELGAGDGHGD